MDKDEDLFGGLNSRPRCYESSIFRAQFPGAVDTTLFGKLLWGKRQSGQHSSA
jgi:hypothetical protein